MTARLVGFHHDAAGYLMYYMLHDAHTRGQIVLQARLLGYPIKQKTMIGMWSSQASEGVTPTVVIVGAGFGGLNAARALRRAPRRSC